MTARDNQLPPKSSQIDSMQRPVFEEDATQKTGRKIRENPMVPIGMAGFFAAVAYGIRHFRNRPKHVSASMYIMQFRVFAQSIAVGCMGAGMAYTLFKDKFTHKDDKQSEHKKH